MSRNGPTASATGSSAFSTATARLQPRASPKTLTFLFTDLEDSTRLWERCPDAMRDALRRHDAILGAAVEASGGRTVKATGDGMMAVFDSVPDGVAACLDAQLRLGDEPWGETGPLRVRMGLHTGVAEIRSGDYFGPTVNRAARIMAAGHGGQVLLSAAAAALVVDDLPDGVTLRDLGEHRLRSLGRPERVFQLVHRRLRSDFPPLRTQPREPGNLPAQPSAFIGRAAELEEIDHRLGDEAVRLLTLVGPGGTGKTRLALQAATSVARRFADGVFFVDLAPVGDTESVLTAIARSIGLSEASDEPMLAALTRQLRDRHALLVLDNFEQVTAAATTMLELLQRCPRLTLLVTSREPLHVRGEHLLPVPPLALPDGLPRHLTAEQLAGVEAVELFVERSRAVRPDFRLTDANARAVAEICLRLDGLPLAIELATARMRIFSPEALRDRLGSILRLQSAARDVPARQQTLRATIDWSYRLLEPGEQRLLTLLSVFSGATFEALETVVGEVDAELDPLDGVASLVDKSLVRLTDPDDDEPRVVMLETIREYATERLEEAPDAAAAVRRAHAAFFADHAQRQGRELTGQRRDAALAAMSVETENLRTAWRHWVAEGDLDQLNRLVDSLWLLYDGRGWYQATIELTTDLLDVLSRTPPVPERTAQEVTLRTSLARALLALKGYTPEVEEAYARALQVLEGHPEIPQVFPVLRGLASFYGFRAEFEKGARIGREIVRLGERHRDPGMLADGHLVIGSNLAFLGDLHGGVRHLDEGIACLEAQRGGPRSFHVGPNPGVSCRTTSAFVLWMLGSPDRARDRADAAIALAVELEHPLTLAYALFHAGFLHLWRREPDVARDRAVGVLDVAEDHDFPIWGAIGTALLGAANAARGRTDEGLAQLRAGLDLYQGLHTPPVFWPLLLYLHAGACGRAGRATAGLAVIDEALEVAGRGSGPTLLPEFQIVRGDLLAGDDGAAAEACYRRALGIAGELDARMSQLRAATRLFRLSRERDDADEWREQLRGVRATFTEGFATADLVEADELLA